MAEVIEWANGNGWTIKLTTDEAQDLKSELASALLESDTGEITVDLERK